ncbi:MAG TPA: phosphoribosylanthranilate isomerase [Steroidobacteraceae bacterium]
MTTPDAVACAVEAGVDALGFVFASSVRQLTPAVAAKLAAPARGRLSCIAVTRQPTQRTLDEILEVFRPDVLQTDAQDLAGLALPASLALLPVFREHTGSRQLPLRMLFEAAESGSGLPCDWSSAGELAHRSELILAGGLSAANIKAALEQVRPFGVDVSTGVEARPGMKDTRAIVRFVALVREQDALRRPQEKS